MKLPPQAPSYRASGWTGAAVLVVGVLIGSLARPTTWLAPGEPRADAPQKQTDRSLADMDTTELTRPMARGPERPADSDQGLTTLRIDLPPESALHLQRVHDRSVESGMIVQEEGDLVDATVTLGEHAVRAKVRIKGDYLDHLDGDKWSLRVELKDDKLMGMSRFSVQHPKTRGYLWEWLVMQVSRREGLLAPRATFVDLVVNDNDLGIFYLEEHFTKELLESQGRREGPIVRFDESVAMATEEQYDYQAHVLPPTVRRSSFLTTAEINAFGEKRLAQAENLARQLQEAIEQLETIQANVLHTTSYIGGSTWLKAQSAALASRNLEDCLDVDQTARMHALMALFRCKHGLAWKNRRFYHNPVTGLLEPVVFDTLAGLPIGERDPLAMYTHLTVAFMRNDEYHNSLFKHVARMAHPDYLMDVFLEHEEQLRQYSAIMAAEGIVDRQSNVDEIKNTLYDQQVFLRELLRPKNGVNFDCRLLASGELEKNTGDIVVEAWTTTRVPIVVRGFRFANGRFLPARSVIHFGEDQGLGELFGDQVLYFRQNGVSRLAEEPDAVVLPNDGRRATFRFPTDVRLATLRDVREAKRAALGSGEPDKSFKLELTVEYRYLTESEQRSELLWIRRFHEKWSEEGGRPLPRSARETLDAHEFLDYEEGSGELRIRPGTWVVDGDLVVPDGFRLRAGPGTTLRFAEGNGIVSGEPLLFEGTAEEPIRLEPTDATWAGVVVIQAHEPCVWRHVQVRDTDVFARGGWIMTGGVVFYKTPLELYDVSFTDAHGEDALNVFGTSFHMERILVDRCASDAFDGDFVTGQVIDSTFRESVEDGVDVSGSDVDVIGCRFVRVGDKCVSAGENSTVRVRGGVAESASIGIASKDFSRVDVDGFDIRRATYYGIAVYIKKPEFGPSSVVARNVQLGEMGLGEAIVQSTCKLDLNGRNVEGQPLDVKELYRQKILGQ